MFENWKRYVESRDSDQPDDVIEETSVGAGMQGYAGAPLGSKEDNEEFNENEKETSKLKGDKLAEMYSTATKRGGLRISIVSAEEEHAGHVERSQHQGLRNVMEADDDATLPMDDNPELGKNASSKDPIAGLLDKNGYILKKKLGEGEFGVVVLATQKDEFGGHDFAIKILKTSKGGEASSREKRNYNQISKARDSDPSIAKHFPEVFKIFKADEMDFIVMEVLEPLPGSLRGLFGGVEQLMHRQRPMSAAEWPISKFDKDKDVSKRVQTMMSDDSHLEKTLRMTKKSLETFGSAFGGSPGPAVQKDIDIKSLDMQEQTAKISEGITEDEQEAKLMVISAALGAVATMVGENTIAGKALAVASATINTYLGATKALATYPPPFGAIAAGVVIAGGLLQVKKIISTKIPKPPGMKLRGSGGGGGSAPAAPQIPQLQTAQALEQDSGSQISETIAASSQKPIVAQVVSTEVSSVQALDRRTNSAASFG